MHIVNSPPSDNPTPLIVVRGAGEIGSAIAHALISGGHRTILFEDVHCPPAVRRKMSFADAIFEGASTLEGRHAVLAASADEALAYCTRQPRVLPVVAASLQQVVTRLRPHVLIDAKMQKRAVGDAIRHSVPMAVGVGPGFIAGLTVHAVIESAWEDLGRIIWSGAARPPTGEPRKICGVGRERFVYAPCAGYFETDADIGESVAAEDLIARIGQSQIRAPIAGILRGLARNGARIERGDKLAEVDPRFKSSTFSGIAERPRRIATAVLSIIPPQGHRPPSDGF